MIQFYMRLAKKSKLNRKTTIKIVKNEYNLLQIDDISTL